MVRIRKLSVLVIVLILTSQTFSQNLIKNKFDKDNFAFELTFENENDYPIFIDKVGAICQVNFGDFNCEPNLWVPNPLSDFVINVPAKADTVYLKATPVVRIDPGSVATITMSIVPDVARACSSWAIDLSAIVKFNVGYTFQSSAELIMSQDVEKLSFTVYTDDELPTLIFSTEPEKREKAIEELKFSNLEPSLIEDYLKRKLKDKNINVRIAAVNAVNDMKITALSSEVCNNLFATTDEKEISTIVRVIGNLKDPKGTDALIGRMLNGSLDDANYAARALIGMDTPEIPGKIRFVLNRQKKWAASTNEEENQKFYYLASILINYEDEASISLLKHVLNDPATNQDVKYDILANLAGLLETYQVVQDKFILSFKEEYAYFLGNKYDYVRTNSLSLSLACEANDKTKSKLIKKSFKDPSLQVQCKAAVWAGELGYEQYAETITALVNTAKGPEYDEMAEALVKLTPSK
jgi:HEAT repeat protein